MITSTPCCIRGTLRRTVSRFPRSYSSVGHTIFKSFAVAVFVANCFTLFNALVLVGFDVIVAYTRFFFVLVFRARFPWTGESGVADALVGSAQVHARGLLVAVVCQAFVDVRAVVAGSRQPGSTDTAVGSLAVDTVSIGMTVVGSVAFIDIRTGRAISAPSLAACAGRIHLGVFGAVSVDVTSAYARVAFVNTRLSISRVSWSARARVRAVQVGAVGVSVGASRRHGTLVDVGARDAVAGVAGVAGADERVGAVGARRVGRARVRQAEINRPRLGCCNWC